MNFMNSVKSCPPGSVSEGGRCVSVSLKINKSIKPNKPVRERKKKLLRKPLNPVLTIGGIASFGSPVTMGKAAQNPKFRGGKMNPVKQKAMQKRIK